MAIGTSLENRFFRKSDKPSEDFSRNWHYVKSPCSSEVVWGDAIGKWCIFVYPFEVDDAWRKIIDAVRDDQLMCAKVSTALRSTARGSHVICAYTRNWEDRQDLMRTREVLRSLGFTMELGYKRDVDTRRRVYGPDEWYLRA